MADGYAGKILWIDLNKKKSVKKTTSKDLKVGFIGGKGLGSKIIQDNQKPRVDPYDPGNMIVFATGPVTGTLVPASSRFVVVTKSPLVNRHIDSCAGGHWGPELKFAGYDAVVITGKANEPSYAWIDDDKVQVNEAKHLWGRDTMETEKALKEELGDPSVRVVCIGPAGENLVRYACVNTELYRHAGRGGAGAVMGSKNLKAIAVRGTGGVDVADIGKLEELSVEAADLCKKDHVTGNLRPNYGTTWGVLAANQQGQLPVRNFSGTYYEDAEEISGEKMRREGLIFKDRGCFSCTLRCGKVSLVRSGPYAGTLVEGPEYETLGMLGSNLDVKNPAAIVKANLLCDKYGMDTISIGGTIAFAMECFEKGFISKEDTDGVELTFGNEEAVMTMIEMIGSRRGFGNVLAEGSLRSAEKIGHDSIGFAIQVKGLEIAAYDPRGVLGNALSYMIADSGGSHVRCWPLTAEYPKKSAVEIVPNVISINDEVAALQSMVLCLMTRFNAWDGNMLAKILSTVTGFPIDLEGLKKIGERIYNMIRVFNYREAGEDRIQDTAIPKRWWEPVPTGPAKGCMAFFEVEDLARTLDEYYRKRGWDSEGRPTREKLDELGLGEIAKDLER